jgi:hypothetical protein
MIIDAFLYAGETEMMELRLRTLDHVVDRFIPVQSTVTHQGQPIPASFLAYPIGPDIPACDPPRVIPIAAYPEGARGGADSPLYQQVERQQRDGVRQAVLDVLGTDAGHTPIVMVSDVDEIPSPDAVADLEELLELIAPPTGWLVLEQRFHSSHLDWLHPQQPWLGTCAARLTDLRPQAMRDARGQRDRIGQVYDGGWHLSWMGSDEERQLKLDTFSHAELRGRYDPAASRALRRHANGEQLIPMTLAEIGTETWPAPIVDGTFNIPPDWFVDELDADRFTTHVGKG